MKFMTNSVNILPESIPVRQAGVAGSVQLSGAGVQRFEADTTNFPEGFSITPQGLLSWTPQPQQDVPVSVIAVKADGTYGFRTY